MLKTKIHTKCVDQKYLQIFPAGLSEHLPALARNSLLSLGVKTLMSHRNKHVEVQVTELQNKPRKFHLMRIQF